MAEEFVPEVQKALLDLFIVERACGRPVTAPDLTSALAAKGQAVSDSYILDRLETLASKGTLARSMDSYHASDGAKVELERLKPWVGLVAKDLEERR